MVRSKRKSESQVIGEEGIRIVKGLLPAHWTPREYRPDFGIDLAIELFEQSGHDRFGRAVYDTLGEHLFLQVKSCEVLRPAQVRIQNRPNVELVDPHTPCEKDSDKAIVPVFPFQMETPELVTVQRMSAAVPVLLALVDVPAERAYFVCLNDYIDKIILPVCPDYSEQKSKVVYVPECNRS